ncbi:MAG: hypothetical protein LBI41_01315 [Lactobacillales bacterium]|jgi:hypothetical protein|nr:hypothetical protein [Lactobacillales bacterium]
MYDYFLLTDTKDDAILVRQHTKTMKETFYDLDTGQWLSFNGLMEYMLFESKHFDQYQILDKKEAAIYISRKIFMKYYKNGFVNAES